MRDGARFGSAKEPMNFELLRKVVRGHDLQVRAELRTGELTPWGGWFELPEASYVELRDVGPIRRQSVARIWLNPIVETPRGRLSPRVADKTKVIVEELTAGGASFVVEADGRIRVENP